MKTKTIELYEFDELPKNIQYKVVEKYYNINVDDDFWHSCILDKWVEKLQDMGFNAPEISYTGFWSQGDGASFVCKEIDIKKFITSQKVKTEFKTLLNNLSRSEIDVNGSVDRIDYHYSHEYTVVGNIEVLTYMDDTKRQDTCYKKGDELQELVTKTVRTLSRQIYHDLETEYEFLTKWEQIIETIKANEYTFTITGEMENL
jgi:hypothetical protein